MSNVYNLFRLPLTKPHGTHLRGKFIIDIYATVTAKSARQTIYILNFFVIKNIFFSIYENYLKIARSIKNHVWMLKIASKTRSLWHQVSNSLPTFQTWHKFYIDMFQRRGAFWIFSIDTPTSYPEFTPASSLRRRSNHKKIFPIHHPESEQQTFFS